MTIKNLIKTTLLLLWVASFQSNAEQSKSGAWEIQCSDTCLIGQGIIKNEGNNQSKFGITISNSATANAPVAQINTPLGLYLPKGLGIEIGKLKKAIPLITCVPNGCKAILKLNDDIVEQLNKNKALNVRFYTADSQQKQVSFALAGFKEAFSHVVK